MNNDSNTIWAVVAIVGLYLFYQANQTNAAVTAQGNQLASTTANNPWLTVPAAVNSGLTGIGSLLDGFDNLFTDNSTTD
jgi:hypothetical protein